MQKKEHTNKNPEQKKSEHQAPSGATRDGGSRRRRPSPKHKNRSGGEVTPRKKAAGGKNSGAKSSGSRAPNARREDRAGAAAGGGELVSGVLSVHHRGFGFVLVPEGNDVFIPLDAIGQALDGDTVRTRIISRPAGRNPIGRIVEVTEPSEKETVGLLKRSDSGQLVLVPEDAPARNLPVKNAGSARSGQIVAMNRGGDVTEILGRPGETGLDVRVIARARQLPGKFPAQVQAESEALKTPDFRKLKKTRLDLRRDLVFTIDPVSAEDFDDALSVKQLENGYFELGVHIADVTHFVAADTAIDAEARERGTSIYFVNTVIPMLPEKLANGLCSIRPGEDRPAFSVIMILDSRGTVVSYRIAESIIRSKRRYTYEEAENILNGAADPNARQISLLNSIALLLRRKREEAGSIDFDASSPVITLDERGIPREIRPSQRLDAHRLVEECMLAANRTVASHAALLGSPPFIYRVHDQPEISNSQALLDLLKGYGIDYRMNAEELESEDYRKLLGIIENMEYRDLVQSVALRSMSKAVYETENRGHFGLAFEAYTHFTSPIRRYPDLMVHRLLKEYGRAGMPMSGSAVGPGAIRPFKADRRRMSELREICESSTRLEIRATEAEREYIRLKSMEFLKSRVGKRARGVVSGVTSFGLFVQLSDYLIDGLIHISNLKDDRYVFDEGLYQLRGTKSAKTYRLGDPVTVVISAVSIDEQKGDSCRRRRTRAMESGNERIKCPNCGTEIDVNDILYHQLEEQLKAQFSAQLAADRAAIGEKEKTLEAARAELEKRLENSQAAIDKAVREQTKKLKEQIAAEAKQAALEEQGETIDALKKELGEKNRTGKGAQ
jgi:ribonuclease R